MYCRYCGKVLTTGDKENSCFPDCNKKPNPMVINILDESQLEREQLRSEIEKLRNALSNLYEACMRADEHYELSEYVNGEILDAAQEVLNGGN